jgi:hypothetical protein
MAGVVMPMLLLKVKVIRYERQYPDQQLGGVDSPMDQRH